jgi:pantothenate synthetase
MFGVILLVVITYSIVAELRLRNYVTHANTQQSTEIYQTLHTIQAMVKAGTDQREDIQAAIEVLNERRAADGEAVKELLPVMHDVRAYLKKLTGE